MRDLLPTVAVDTDVPCPVDTDRLFGAPKKEFWLEIGFGGAEHLIARARQFPDVGFIGSEPYEDGIAKALTAIKENNLENVRLYPDDIRTLLAWLPNSSIDRCFILFPDPWPKKRHHKRRLVNPSTLVALAKVMRPGARLRIATDIGDYVRTTFIAVHTNNVFHWLAKDKTDWQGQPEDWIPTRYEQKAIQQGRRCYYFEFERKDESDQQTAS